ncbi:MAG TPA: hypothetical protein VHM48_03375 [Candidatus Limnocylindrales bacterium]|nr:hypothetical protein [Candidatus Limnocylindrales bacterium]
MDIWLMVVQFVHILGGAAWLGGSIFANLVLLPYVFRQAPDRRRGLIGVLILGPERVMIGAAVIGGLMGLVRGTFFGPIRSIDDLGSGYGLTWLGAVVVVLGVFVVGGAVTSRAARRLLDDDALWVASADGRLGDAYATTAVRLKVGFRIELSGILVTLALMEVLRFS